MSRPRSSGILRTLLIALVAVTLFARGGPVCAAPPPAVASQAQMPACVDAPPGKMPAGHRDRTLCATSCAAIAEVVPAAGLSVIWRAPLPTPLIVRPLTGISKGPAPPPPRTA